MDSEKLQKVLDRHKLWLNNMGGASADLRSADLRNANLQNANLWNADLRNANLRNANLQNADLRNADLQSADLRSADLRNADLQNANLRNANLHIPINCPEIGSFTAFKKLQNGCIATLIIPEHAKRSSATSRKCRASEAFVVKIENTNGQEITSCVSDRGGWYEVGKTTYPDSFDGDRWNECSNGIHFFITRREAEEYNG